MFLWYVTIFFPGGDLRDDISPLEAIVVSQGFLSTWISECDTVWFLAFPWMLNRIVNSNSNFLYLYLSLSFFSHLPYPTFFFGSFTYCFFFFLSTFFFACSLSVSNPRLQFNAFIILAHDTLFVLYFSISA